MLKKPGEHLTHQKSYGFSKCGVLNCHSFLCCITTLFLQIRYTDLPHRPHFYVSDRLHRVNPKMLQMHLPSHPMGSLTRKDAWRGSVTTGTPKIRSPVPDHMPAVVIIEPHDIQPSPYTGFTWFRLTRVVLQVILTPKVLVVRFNINFNPLQV